MARRRRKQDDKHEKPKRHPIVRLITADIVLRTGSLLLRRAVRKGLVPGKAADAVPDHPPSISTRLLTAAASTVASRSVPGAVFVGSSLVVRTLYRRGKARQAERIASARDVGGVLPPT